MTQAYQANQKAHSDANIQSSVRILGQILQQQTLDNGAGKTDDVENLAQDFDFKTTTSPIFYPVHAGTAAFDVASSKGFTILNSRAKN